MDVVYPDCPRYLDAADFRAARQREDHFLNVSKQEYDDLEELMNLRATRESGCCDGNHLCDYKTRACTRRLNDLIILANGRSLESMANEKWYFDFLDAVCCIRDLWVKPWTVDQCTTIMYFKGLYIVGIGRGTSHYVEEEVASTSDEEDDQDDEADDQEDAAISGSELERRRVIDEEITRARGLIFQALARQDWFSEFFSKKVYRNYPDLPPFPMEFFELVVKHMKKYDVRSQQNDKISQKRPAVSANGGARQESVVQETPGPERLVRQRTDEVVDLVWDEDDEVRKAKKTMKNNPPS